MTLSELNPRWVVGNWRDAQGVSHFGVHPSVRHGMGVSFDCPVHRNHRLAVMFSNPVDGLPPVSDHETLWQRTGETLESLSLTPSIDASQSGWGNPSTPCWHGFITNGQAV